MLNTLTRLVARHRRALAALTAGLLILALARVVSPPPPPTAPLLVAARALPGGAPITADDVRVIRVEPAAVPEQAFTESGSVVGKTLAAPMSKGSPLTAHSLVSARAAAPGRVLAPLRISDQDLARLLVVGDTVDILTASELGSSVVAREALVMAIPAKQAETGFGPSGVGGALIVVQVTPSEATALAAAAARGRLSVAWR